MNRLATVAFAFLTGVGALAISTGASASASAAGLGADARAEAIVLLRTSSSAWIADHLVAERAIGIVLRNASRGVIDVALADGTSRSLDEGEVVRIGCEGGSQEQLIKVWVTPDTGADLFASCGSFVVIRQESASHTWGVAR